MTRKSVTDEDYGKLQRRLSEISRRVDEGSIPFKETMDALQEIIEGNFPEPKEILIGDRVYEVLKFHRQDEELITGYLAFARAIEMGLVSGIDEGEYILKHQEDIPAILRKRLVFVLPHWFHSDDSSEIYFVRWERDCWTKELGGLHLNWGSNGRFLRRKS